MKTEKKLSRAIIKEKLLEYISKKITLSELMRWSDDIVQRGMEPNDWEGDDSFINEIVKLIDLGDIDGLSVSKVKKILKLLNSNLSTDKLIRRLHKNE